MLFQATLKAADVLNTACQFRHGTAVCAECCRAVPADSLLDGWLAAPFARPCWSCLCTPQWGWPPLTRGDTARVQQSASAAWLEALSLSSSRQQQACCDELAPSPSWFVLAGVHSGQSCCAALPVAGSDLGGTACPSHSLHHIGTACLGTAPGCLKRCWHCASGHKSVSASCTCGLQGVCARCFMKAPLVLHSPHD